jgi:uncharacterized protein (DUF952 family)
MGKSVCRLIKRPGPLSLRSSPQRARARPDAFLEVFTASIRPLPPGVLMTTIYKICEAAQWEEAQRDGKFVGSAVDFADGYIHFSTAGQAAATAARHFAGQADLVIVAVSAAALGAALKWEVSRGGALFPHLYGALPLAAVRWAKPLRRDDDGRHLLPPLEE